MVGGGTADKSGIDGGKVDRYEGQEVADREWKDDEEIKIESLTCSSFERGNSIGITDKCICNF